MGLPSLTCPLCSFATRFAHLGPLCLRVACERLPVVCKCKPLHLRETSFMLFGLPVKGDGIGVLHCMMKRWTRSTLSIWLPTTRTLVSPAYPFVAICRWRSTRITAFGMSFFRSALTLNCSSRAARRRRLTRSSIVSRPTVGAHFFDRFLDLGMICRFDKALFLGLPSLWCTSLPSPFFARPALIISARALFLPARSFFSRGLFLLSVSFLGMVAPEV